ncbi:MAG: hypothetical protein WCV93_01510 [Candidatus Shapirobacteria bacterium]|jgi:hypothetical protein
MDYKIGFFGVKSWEREAIEKEIIRLPSFGVGIFEKEVQDDVELWLMREFFPGGSVPVLSGQEMSVAKGVEELYGL